MEISPEIFACLSTLEIIDPFDTMKSPDTKFIIPDKMYKLMMGGHYIGLMLKNLQENYNKLVKNLSNINIELSELQAGKSSVKTMFKNKEKEISRLTNEKENLEKNIDDLGNVIKIATFNMQKEINEFKISELDSYYAELSRIENDTEKNAKIFDDLWEAIINDKNISEFN
jgi:chromosome segregation ATPase